jgi:hypothetical protein
MSETAVVLFPHPGAEHDSTRLGPVYPWNRQPAPHRRKFLTAWAHFAREASGGWRIDPAATPAALWTEYEPSTRIWEFPDGPAAGLPSAWHSLLPIGEVPPRAHGTDPWVFGANFRYGICKQSSVPYLQDLAPGSIIFFGSWMKRDESGKKVDVFNFFLDTVFVVGASYPNAKTDDEVPKDALDPAYRRAEWDRIRERDRGTFYTGAGIGSGVSKEPFSWVPSKAVPGGDSLPPRFPRPMIGQLFGKAIGNGQATIRLAGVQPKDAWTRVVEHCRKRGLELGARVESPLVSESAPAASAAGPCREGRSH